jgi:hypothetical protein
MRSTRRVRRNCLVGPAVLVGGQGAADLHAAGPPVGEPPRQRAGLGTRQAAPLPGGVGIVTAAVAAVAVAAAAQAVVLVVALVALVDLVGVSAAGAWLVDLLDRHAFELELALAGPRPPSPCRCRSWRTACRRRRGRTARAPRSTGRGLPSWPSRELPRASASALVRFLVQLLDRRHLCAPAGSRQHSSRRPKTHGEPPAGVFPMPSGSRWPKAWLARCRGSRRAPKGHQPLRTPLGGLSRPSYTAWPLPVNPRAGRAPSPAAATPAGELPPAPRRGRRLGTSGGRRRAPSGSPPRPGRTPRSAGTLGT